MRAGWEQRLPGDTRSFPRSAAALWTKLRVKARVKEQHCADARLGNARLAAHDRVLVR